MRSHPIKTVLKSRHQSSHHSALQLLGNRLLRLFRQKPHRPHLLHSPPAFSTSLAASGHSDSLQMRSRQLSSSKCRTGSLPFATWQHLLQVELISIFPLCFLCNFLLESCCSTVIGQLSRTTDFCVQAWLPRKRLHPQRAQCLPVAVQQLLTPAHCLHQKLLHQPAG